MGTNHLNFGYESPGYETSVGTKRPVRKQGLVDEIARYDAWRLPEVFPNLWEKRYTMLFLFCL